MKQRQGYSKGDEQVRNILTAATNVLIDHGYHNFSMRRVASTAGISVGNLQYYFATKEILVEAMLDDVINGYLAVFDEIRHHGSPREQFESIVRAVVMDLPEKQTTRFFPELWSMANHHENLTKYMDAMYGRYRDVLASTIRDINPKLTKRQANTLALFVSCSLEGHTVFVGHHKPWTKETKNIADVACQSFLWLIENGVVPQKTYKHPVSADD